jgi:hypothetical protein
MSPPIGLVRQALEPEQAQNVLTPEQTGIIKPVNNQQWRELE